MVQFIFNPTQSYLPAYNQLQFGMTSDKYTRGSFAYLVDVKVDGNLITTLTSQNTPGTTWSNVDIHRVASTALSYDLNYSILGATSTPNSIKQLDVEAGETYNNVIQILGITQSGQNTMLYVSDSTLLQNGDRVEIQLNDTSATPHLNDFWRVVAVNPGEIVIDDYDWSYPGFTQSGVLREGREYLDASYNFNDNTVIIETIQPHLLNDGDTFLLQLDTYAFATIDITSQTGVAGFNSIDIFRAGITYSILSTSITSGSITGLLGLLTSDINSSQTHFTAYDDGNSILYIYSRRNQGDATVGCQLNITPTGTIGFTFSNFTKTPQQGPKGGWNSFSGIWKVNNVINSNQFSTKIPWQFNTITNSQRGTILSFNNYTEKGLTAYGDRWLMNHTFQYDDFFNYPDPPLVLTEDPRDCIPFSSWDDLMTVDIMTLLGPTGSNVSQFLMRFTYPLGGTFSDYFYTLDTQKGSPEPRVSFGVGPGNLSGLSTTFSSMQPQDYNITIYDDFGNIFYNQDFCYKCRTKEYFRVMWLNKWGAFDYYDFNYADRSVEGEKETFYRAIGNYNGSSWVKTPGERGLTVYDNRTFDKYLFYTDLLKRNEGEWLISLFNSPEVYILDGSNIKPLIITSEEIFRFNAGNKIRQIQFEARLAYNNITQIN